MKPNPSVPALSAVLPLPPMEYDVAYMNNLIRILNFFIQQLQRSGPIRCSGLVVEDKDRDTYFSVSPVELYEVLSITMTNLPTSSTGLTSGQLWVDTASGNVLKIVP